MTSFGLSTTLLAAGLAGAALAAPGQAGDGPRCRPISESALKDLAKAAGQPLELHFFATWCSDCKEHLTGALPKTAVLIAWFDDGDRAGAALRRLNIEQPCFLDEAGQFAAGLGVREIPAMRIYGGK